MNPYIYEIATHGFVAMAAIGGTAIFYSRLLNAERARAIEAQRDKETSINSLIACRSTCDMLKAKNEELRHDVDRIQAERDTLKAENEQLLMARANYRQAVEDRDSRIRNLETRLNDADARRISAERKAEPVNTPETAETQGELDFEQQYNSRKQKTEKLICDFLAKIKPGEWKTIQEISEAIKIDVGTVNPTLSMLHKKWKVARCVIDGEVMYTLESERPKTWDDVNSRMNKCTNAFLFVLKSNPKKWQSTADITQKTRYSSSAIGRVGCAMEAINVVQRKTIGNVAFFKLNPNFPTA